MKEIDIDEWIEWINQLFALKRENTWIMSVDMKEMRERQIMKEIDTEAVFKFQVSNWNLISLDPGFLIELLRVNFDIFWPLQNDIFSELLGSLRGSKCALMGRSLRQKGGNKKWNSRIFIPVIIELLTNIGIIQMRLSTQPSSRHMQWGFWRWPCGKKRRRSVSIFIMLISVRWSNI